MKFFVRQLIFLFLVTGTISCGTAKHLVYIDDWEGSYKLFELNSCCETATKIRLEVSRDNGNLYSWKLFSEADKSSDTIRGKAVYEKNKLKFYLGETRRISGYFEEEIGKKEMIFRMEYDNYSTDDSYRYVGCYTRWNYPLKGYKPNHSLFAGTSYHFKAPGKDKRRLAR